MTIRTMISLVMIFFAVKSHSQVSSVKLNSYKKGIYEVTASQSDMGGGGYITGIVQDFKNSDILYGRSDVAGVFKSVNGGKSWNLSNAGLNKMTDNYCHSFAMDPFDNKTLLRASGDVRNFKFIGRIHRSTDGGKSWSLVKDGLDYYGNGFTRIFGEMIAYNQDKKGEVAAGTYSRGVWLSGDGGSSWNYSGLKGERISSVKFYNNKIYAGTICDSYFSTYPTKEKKSVLQLLKEMQDFPRGDKGRIYVSEDGGKTWTILFEKQNTPVLEFIITDNGNKILFTSTSGVYKSNNAGKSFELINDLPQSTYRALVQSSLEPNVFYAAEIGLGKIAIPIYRSEDKGESWKLISPDPKAENLSNFPSWHGNNPEKIGARISDILPDNKNPNKLYISNWWGVTITDDLGKSYNGNNFEGIGILCSETIRKHPTKKDVIFAGICDHALAMSQDAGNKFTMLSYGAWPPTRVACLSKRNPELILSVSETKGEEIKLYKSEDGGKTGRITFAMKGKNYIQDIKEDPLTAGRFWAFVEGDAGSENRPGIYVSDDSGDTWKPTISSPFAHLKSVPADEFKIDNDLVPIVNYQYKNGNGTGQLLALDEYKSVIYAGEWTSGIYRSSDNGKSWTNIGKKLPFNSQKNAVLQFVYAHPYQEGVVYAGFWNEGLWKSDDFGNSWKRIKIGQENGMNASSMSIERNEKGEIITALACSNHPQGDSKTALWISSDNEKSWTDIYDYSIGSVRFISIVLDAVRQRIYTATAGNGVMFFDYK